MATTTNKEIDVVLRVLTDSGSYDNTISGLVADNIKEAIDELKSDVDAVSGHAALTLNADATTNQTLNLSGQELQVNLATPSDDGAMSSEDKTKLDGIEAGAEVNDTLKTINGESLIGVGNIVIGGGGSQIQSDWDQTDNLEVDFILNKPIIPEELADLTGDLDDIADGTTYVKSENNYTDAEKSKLAAIAAGAEVNVNADWNSMSGDSQILNKPTLYSPPSNVYSNTTGSDLEKWSGSAGTHTTIWSHTFATSGLHEINYLLLVRSYSEYSIDSEATVSASVVWANSTPTTNFGLGGQDNYHSVSFIYNATAAQQIQIKFVHPIDGASSGEYTRIKAGSKINIYKLT